uniref:Uncharacterized protein n=1 Tax=Romanomermis culicivorax TaxID=13658 RepID=A0A915HXE1_ROMCU
KSAFYGITDGKQFHPFRSLPSCFPKSRTVAAGVANLMAENWVRDLAHTPNITMAESEAF